MSKSPANILCERSAAWRAILRPHSFQSSDEATPSDDSAPPAVATPDATGGALPVGARVQMHSMNNMEVWRGRITQALSNTPADHRRVVWDDGCWVSTVPANRLEKVS